MDNILSTETAERPNLLEGKIIIDCIFASVLFYTSEKSGATGNCPLPPSLNGNHICI